MKVGLELDGHPFEITLHKEDGSWSTEVDGEGHRVRTDRRGPGTLVTVDGHAHWVDIGADGAARLDGEPVTFRLTHLEGVAGAEDQGGGQHGPIHPPMTGRLVSIEVASGQAVSAGDILFVIEAMKMRNQVKAPSDGIIGTVHAQPGDPVDSSAPILDLERPG